MACLGYCACRSCVRACVRARCNAVCMRFDADCGGFAGRCSRRGHHAVAVYVGGGGELAPHAGVPVLPLPQDDAGERRTQGRWRGGGGGSKDARIYSTAFSTVDAVIVQPRPNGTATLDVT